jgi:hypothetical protein
METQPGSDKNPETAPLPSLPEDIIEACCNLLSSGRPLSEVLAETHLLVLTERSVSRPMPESRPDVVEEAGPGRAVSRSRSRRRGFGLLILGLVALLATAAAAIGTKDQAQASPVPLATAPIPEPIKTPTSAPPEHVHASEPLPATSTSLSGPEVVAFIARGDSYMANAEVRAARLLYERAVLAGDAEAALRLGATYDPEFIRQAHLRVQADESLARYWYAWAGVAPHR